MSWRTVVITKPSKLDLKLGSMVVRDYEQTVRIYIDEIAVLLVESTGCSVTTALLHALTQKKIKVIFCDDKRNPSSELMAYAGCHDASMKLRNQIGWSEGKKQAVWTAIVAAKIRKQAENLDYFGLPQAQMLYGYLEQLKYNDATNREGHAAKVYFNALFGKSFSRSEECPVNAALNYGYSILLSCFNREIVCSGYSTQLGLFHNNMFNCYNLSCDLMEPFRPIVDRYVKEEGITTFEAAEKHGILTLLQAEFWIEGRRQTLLNAIKLYCKSVFDAIESGDLSYIRLYSYEL